MITLTGRRREVRQQPAAAPVDVEAIRRHFAFPAAGRVVTNNAASTQPPRELLELYRSLAPAYENVHRGQSTASQQTTELFEQAYDTIAQFSGHRAGAASRCTGIRPRPSTRSCTRC